MTTTLISGMAWDRSSPRQVLSRMSVLLLLLFGASYVYFAQAGLSANVICRAALTANIVQHGRIDINGYDTETVDKAFYDGNYYCDKAPGMSFLAIPVAYAFTRAFPVTVEAAKSQSKLWHAYVFLCAISTSALFAAFGGLVLFRYLADRTGDLSAALVGSLTFGLGTPIWGWATSFFSHATAGALLLMGFVALDGARRLAADGKSVATLAALSGLALGVATAVEYTSFVAALIIGACIAVVSPWRSHARPVLAMFAIAGAIAFCALVPVLIYHAAAFGSPFTPGYRYAVVFKETRDNFGVAIPDFSRIFDLLFGFRRGLIWMSPVMIASAWAVVTAVRQPAARMPVIAAVLILAWFLVFNGGFSYWLGGYSTGPRYLTPAAGLMALPLGLAWPWFRPWERRFTLVLLAISIFINLACTAVDMTAPEDLSNPIAQLIIPSLIDGHLGKTVIFKVTGRDGLLVLVPLLAIAAVLGGLLSREVRRGAKLLTGGGLPELGHKFTAAA